MAVELSISRAIDKCVKKAKELKEAKHDLRKSDVKQDCEIEIGEIVNSLVLSMDKVMNAVWRSYVEDRDKKPDIYFPCEASEEKYHTRMQRYRLTHLVQVAPDLADIIYQVQPCYTGDRCWWKLLKDVAAIRHERHPDIVNPRLVTHGIGVGRGQNLHIEHLTFNNGVMNFKGQAWDARTGQAVPIRVDYLEEVQAELAETNQNPFDFVVTASEQVSSTAKRIGVHL